MVRMIISLPEKDKKWLDRTGRHRGISSAELVRQAVMRLRESEPAAELGERVVAYAGRWKNFKTDGQKYVDSLRDAWERKP